MGDPDEYYHLSLPGESPVWRDGDALLAWMLMAGCTDERSGLLAAIHTYHWIAMDECTRWFIYHDKPHRIKLTWNTDRNTEFAAPCLWLVDRSNCPIHWEETLLEINKGVKP